MAAALRSGEVSSRELVEAHLEVAERQNRALNVWLASYAASGKAVVVATHDRELAAHRRVGLSVETTQALGSARVGV